MDVKLRKPTREEIDQTVTDIALGAAWREAEAALPNTPQDNGHPLWRFGPWRLRVVGPWDIEHNGHRPSYQAIADPYNAGMSHDPRDREIEAIGPTPSAALRTLAEKLRSV